MKTGSISRALDLAIRSGATELRMPGRPMCPGRLVRIACYQRYGMNLAARQLGVAKNTLEEWLRANDCKLVGKGNRRARTPSPRALPVADACASTAAPRAGEESRCETHATSAYTQNPAEFGCETLPTAADVQRESDALSRTGRLTEAERNP